MADFCDKSEIMGKAPNVLANRWFQPLTHVSEARTPRDTAFSCQQGKREKRGEHRFRVAQSAAQSVLAAF